MGLLDSLRSAYNQAVANRQAAIRRRDQYYAKANQIRSVYNAMKPLKSEAQTILSQYTQAGNMTYDTFCGTNHDSVYMTSVNAAISSLTALVNEIDANMDNLNSECTRYENLGLNENGLVGRLASSINSLWSQIQNATN